MKLKYIIIVFSSLWLVACNANKEKKEAQPSIVTYDMLEAAFISSLTANDTITVLNAGDSLMMGLKMGELETSIRKLYMPKDGKIVPIDEEKVKGLVNRFKRFPVLDYKLSHCIFSIETLNDLKYTIEFAPKDKNGKAPTISFVLNPVKMDSIWYLCVKEMNQSSKDMLNPIHPKTPVY